MQAAADSCARIHGRSIKLCAYLRRSDRRRIPDARPSPPSLLINTFARRATAACGCRVRRRVRQTTRRPPESQGAVNVRIPRKMGIDSTASWAAIPRLGQSGRLAHRVRLDPLGQAVSSCSRACACFRRQGATGERYGRADREWRQQWSAPRLLRANARPGAGW